MSYDRRRPTNFRRCKCGSVAAAPPRSMNVTSDSHVIPFSNDEWPGVVDADRGGLQWDTTLDRKGKATNAVILAIYGAPV